METILITGGLGQIGAHLCLKLKDRYNIIVIDNCSNSKIEPSEDISFYRGEIQDSQTFTKLPEIDYIIHTAAQISINKSTNDPLYDADNNIWGTLQVLEYARKNEIKKFVQISSAAKYGNPQYLPIDEEHPTNPLSPYGLSKFVSEKYALLYSELYGLDVSVITPFNVYSSLQGENDPYAGVIYKFIKAIKEGNSPKVEGDGMQTRDFIHVNDVCYAIDLALTSKNTKGMQFNIGAGRPVTILELAKILMKYSKKKLEMEFTEPRLADIRDSYCSISKAKEVLGFKPKISLDEGLKDMYRQIL